MRSNLKALGVAAALGALFAAGCEKKTVTTTTTESTKSTEAPTPVPTVAMGETPVPPPAATPGP
jgi:hypothetical protein